jgi:hypothetical protein
MTFVRVKNNILTHPKISSASLKTRCEITCLTEYALKFKRKKSLIKRILFWVQSIASNTSDMHDVSVVGSTPSSR